jgi:predicted Mrr-cat superfamily restriction endonuclease
MSDEIKVGDWVAFYEQGDEMVCVGKVVEITDAYFCGETWCCIKSECYKIRNLDDE